MSRIEQALEKVGGLKFDSILAKGVDRLRESPLRRDTLPEKKPLNISNPLLVTMGGGMSR